MGYKVILDGKMFLEIGPASLVIIGEKDGEPYEFQKEKLVQKVKSILGEIREFLPVLKQKAYKIKNTKHMPDVPRKMVEAVKAIDEASLTPMAAVAGAVADAIKKFLKNEGLDLVSVNNGGDISIFNKKGRCLKIDIGDIHTGESSPYMLNIEQLIDFGLATSGFGGRSFTLGLADSVTVIAATGAVADAAATFICNCTNTESDQVVRQKASEIDSLTDIPDDNVTIIIGQLNDRDILKALDNGLSIAANNKNKKHIYDAILKLRGHMVTTINGDNPIKLEVRNGN
jgi:ApbE superfamily uncharacterized protein (UPF0280 family)